MKALKQNDYHYWDGYLCIDMETFDIESNGECEDIQIKDMEFFKFSYM